MDIEVTYTPTDLAQLRLAGRIVVVMDIVRASTTITAGLAAGCAGFSPVASLAAARRIVREHADEAILLGGERQGIIVPGFDLGNSPGEYHSGNVLGKRVAFTTTNGTRVIAAAKDAERVVIGALVNLEAVAQYLVAEGKPVVLAAGDGKAARPSMTSSAQECWHNGCRRWQEQPRSRSRRAWRWRWLGNSSMMCWGSCAAPIQDGRCRRRVWARI